ncbi:HAD family hydrolase [Anaerorhabdus sp.]|uniref:HAD family hydrolase n=1 Tax=Anaerorhabdus sp. TaxID=1872524 RepID=UPI002FC96535
MTKIKAIVFDFDGTLSCRPRCAYDKYKSDVHYVFPDLKENTIEFESVVQNLLTWDQYGTINKDYVYRQLVKTYNLDEKLVDVLTKRWLEDFHTFSILREGVKETLIKLRENYKVGCITNGNSQTQHSKLEYCNLKEYFDSVIVSGDLGVHKPDPRIFHESCRQLGVNPSEMVYVGDTFYADVYGAHLAGCIPVWIWNDEERHCDTDVIRIHEFIEILEAIDKIENQ